jgi:hypothetical protein
MAGETLMAMSIFDNKSKQPTNDHKLKIKKQKAKIQMKNPKAESHGSIFAFCFEILSKAGAYA